MLAHGGGGAEEGSGPLDVVEVVCRACDGHGEDRRGDYCRRCDAMGTVLIPALPRWSERGI